MKNIYELTNDERTQLKLEIYRRCYGKTAFPYYINNCVSCDGCPKWIGSLACDIMFRLESGYGISSDMDIVGYYINNIFYDNDSQDHRLLAEAIVDSIVPKEYIDKIRIGLVRYC